MNKRKEDDEKGREDERIHEKRLDYKVIIVYDDKAYKGKKG